MSPTTEDPSRFPLVHQPYSDTVLVTPSSTTHGAGRNRFQSLPQSSSPFNSSSRCSSGSFTHFVVGEEEECERSGQQFATHSTEEKVPRTLPQQTEEAEAIPNSSKKAEVRLTDRMLLTKLHMP